MTDNTQNRQRKRRIRRKLGLEFRRAILGDSAGVVYEPGRPGYVRVRYPASGDNSDGLGFPTVVRLKVSIPANSTATVFVPVRGPADVTEGSQPAERADGVSLVRTEPGLAVYAVQSGAYRLVSAHAPVQTTCGGKG